MLRLASCLKVPPIHGLSTRYLMVIGESRCNHSENPRSSNSDGSKTDDSVVLASGSAYYKQEANNLKAAFETVVRGLTARHAHVPEAASSLNELLRYNMAGGKMFRGLMFLHVCTQLCQTKNIPDENSRLKYIMCIVIELLHAGGLTLDDLIDGSDFRRGKPSWSSLKKLNHSVVNDVCMIKSSGFAALHHYFSNQPYYRHLLQILNEVYHASLLGQALDIAAQGCDGKPRIELFTMVRFRSLAKYKTGIHTFYFPFCFALTMVDCNDSHVAKRLKDILLEMGTFMQIKNDYCDCYKDSQSTGKDGNDIQKGKCTWLAVVALQYASAKQRVAFQECYGKQESSNIAVILNIYEELGLEHEFLYYKQDFYNKLCNEINQMPTFLPRQIFFNILNTLFSL